MVYPALCLAYLGQGARLVIDPVNVLPNVFFQSIPGGTGGGFWWFTFVFAILAAIIASQGTSILGTEETRRY
jgi:KUP system potassium uptake protein